MREIIQQYIQESRETNAQLLHDSSLGRLVELVRENTRILHIGETAFKMVALQGEDTDSAIVIAGEFGNGIRDFGSAARVMQRALVIRNFVNPDASLILQPNSAFRENSMNFTKEERGILETGRAFPIVDRMQVALQGLDGGEYLKDVTLSGKSQGSLPALEFAAQYSAAVAALETPNVMARGALQLAARDFPASSTESILKDVIRSNFQDGDILREELPRTITPMGLAAYALGSVIKRDNRSLIRMLAEPTAEKLIQDVIIRGGSVVHAWADESTVSPHEHNQAIADAMRQYLSSFDTYESYRHDAPSDHSLTNNYHLVAALTKRARELHPLHRN